MKHKNSAEFERFDTLTINVRTVIISFRCRNV